MNKESLNSLSAALRAAALLVLITVQGEAFAADACAGQGYCVETRSFAAVITNFRTSKQSAQRIVTATVRFQNKTDRPLTLGYVKTSGVAMDDEGNRYVVWGPSSVRGIGEIVGNAFDSKFTLQPQERSDARFELVWNETPQTVAGTRFELDLAVREITEVAVDQFRLGQEHSLHFERLGGAMTAAAGAEAAPASAATPNSVPAIDPCAGVPRCYNAGPFVAEIAQFTPSQVTAAGRHHYVQINVRFRNVSNRPIVLAYHAGTSVAIDNYGQRYGWGVPGTHDTSAQGIGYVEGRKVDPQFALNPGQARNAMFNVYRKNAFNTAIGTAYNYDVVIDELEVLPSQQVRTAAGHSLSFPGLTAGSFAVAAMPAQPADVAQQMIDLIKNLPKKK